MNLKSIQQKMLWFFGFSVTAIFVFLIWKCRFGFADVDETFYLTVPYRLCKGDALLYHEWHPSQLAGFLEYPVMWLFLLFHPSPEGIVLLFRYIFTVIWTLAAVFFFVRLRRFSLIGAMAASLAFLLYTPYGIMQLCYNSMGVLFLLAACVIYSTVRKRPRLDYFFSGVCLAGSVLCCPYLAAVYAVFTLYVILRRFLKAKTPAGWLWVTLGCAVMAFLLLLHMLINGAKLGDLTRTIPMILNDPQHPQLPLATKAEQYFQAVFNFSKLFPAVLYLSVLTMFVTKLTRAGKIGLIIMCVLVMILQFDLMISNPYPNFIMFPVNLLAPYCALHSRKKSVQMPFWLIWIPGLIYTFCIHLSSNQIFYAISSASSVMTAATLVIAASFIRTLDKEKRLPLLNQMAGAMVILVLFVQMGSEFLLRYSFIFWEPNGLPAQTAVVERGVEKGIHMRPEKRTECLDDEKEVEAILAGEPFDSILLVSRKCNIYLSLQKEFATYSAWLSKIKDETIVMLHDYFDIIPDKMPDVIYIEKLYVQYLDTLNGWGYRSEPMASGGYLLRRLEPGAP